MDALLYVGLSNAVLAALLAIVAAVVTRLWPRPALAHALWLLVLLKLVTPPLVPLRLAWPFEMEASRDGEEAVNEPLPIGRGPAGGDDSVTSTELVIGWPGLESSKAPAGQEAIPK